MLKGNKSQAIIAITELLVQALKYGISAKNPQCWNWQTPSEKALLEDINKFACSLSLEILIDFQEQSVDFVYGKIPKTKFAGTVQRTFLEFYLKNTFSLKRAQIQTRAAKKFFEEKLKILSNDWGDKNDRGKTESRKNAKNKSVN